MNAKKLDGKSLLLCVAIPLAVGTLAGLLTREGMADFSRLAQPPLAPPGWLFAVVWPLLYILMGIASYVVLHANGTREAKRGALMAYGAQLLLNFLWPILYFNAGRLWLAFWCLLALWLMVLLTLVLFGRLSRKAGWMLLPYLLWLSFALYLNLGTALLN